MVLIMEVVVLDASLHSSDELTTSESSFQINPKCLLHLSSWKLISVQRKHRGNKVFCLNLSI